MFFVLGASVHSLMAQVVKNLPAMQEIGLQSLGQEDRPKQEMATHCGILLWEIPWTEEPGGLQSMGLQSWTRLKRLNKHKHTCTPLGRKHTHTHTHTHTLIHTRIHIHSGRKSSPDPSQILNFPSIHKQSATQKLQSISVLKSLLRF